MATGAMAAPPADRAVAVTFDDLPGPPADLLSNDIFGLRENTAKLLASFREHSVPAVGFVNEGKLFVEGESAGRGQRHADAYAGNWGISWVRHWELSDGRRRSSSPDPPDWITKASAALWR
jgi:peptidoglycan/xylan/chitin deacetylase (PgdA/CDA1 family)